MLPSRKRATIHSRPLTRPTPIAYALSSETSTATTATAPAIKVEFHSFCG